MVNVRLAMAQFAALLVLLAGCGKSADTYIDVTVTAETGVMIDGESVVATAPRKSALEHPLPFAMVQHLTIAPTGLVTGTIVTIEARGLKGGNVTVRDRAQVAVLAGGRRAVSLSLTTACVGITTCTAVQTCHAGTCVPIPVVNPSDDGGAGAGGHAGSAGGQTGGTGAAGHGGGGGTAAAGGIGNTGGSSGAPGSCAEGTTQSCGAAPLNKKGACGLDTATCTNGQWAGCLDTKGVDSCEPGNDDSCNGLSNEGCPCVNGDTQDCGHAAVGICKPGKSTCKNTVWGACVGNVEPAARDCSSAMDNDCDGHPDNTVDTVCKCAVGGAPQTCGAHPGNDGKGPCKAGAQTCVLATNKQTSDWGACTGAVGPSATDSCDPGNDNNCNGSANEGCSCVNGGTQSCGHATVGICKAGTATCANSVWGACVGNIDPAARDCTSSKDNDCNGTADNAETTSCTCAVGTSQACQTHPGFDGKGICKAGTQSCVASADKTTSGWGPCSGAVGPSTEVCDAAMADENCDGSSNEGCQCVNGTSVPCTCGPATTCTNGKKGTCSVTPVTMYRDADGDGYGNPGQSAQVCAGTAGYASNGDDCDDSNGAFKPGVSICSSATQKATCASGNAGVAITQSCDQGCFGGNCRSDGTIGVPGYVSCGNPPNAPKCTTAQGCNLTDTSCGATADFRLFCDGQSDCPGQICCIQGIRGSTLSQCYDGTTCPASMYPICDPLQPVCPTNSICVRYSSDFSLYACE